MNDIVKNKTEQSAEENIAYEDLPARELIKVTDENAPALWAAFCSAREEAAESFKESRYYGTSLYAKDIFMSACMATMLGVILKWGKLPSIYKVRLSEELEENLKNYRKQKLYQLVRTDERYWTDGERIFPDMDTWNVESYWDKLKQILAKEKERGIYSDLLGQEMPPFDVKTGDIHAYTDRVRKDTTIQVIRRFVLASCVLSENKIVSDIGIPLDEVEMIAEECDIRKKIDSDLNRFYFSESIIGLNMWIQNSMKEGRSELEIAYLAGLSPEKTREWIKDPEKHINEDFDRDNQFNGVSCLFEINEMPPECKKAMYEKYLRE